MSRAKQAQSGFTLLEVLVASSILFIIGAAVVGLSNSILQGTVNTANKTVTNRAAVEGLEIVTKIRNDRVRAGGSDLLWLAQAESPTKYGWYALKQNASSWELQPAQTATTGGGTLPLELIVNPDAGLTTERIVSDAFESHRLICIEAVGALPGDVIAGAVGCNRASSANDDAANDGSRANPSFSVCQRGDAYCALTKESLAKNRRTGQVIPPGNAVRVRSVVVWQDRDQNKVSDLAILLTNNQGFEQINE